MLVLYLTTPMYRCRLTLVSRARYILLSHDGHHETAECIVHARQASICNDTSVWLNTKPALLLMYSISFRSPPSFVFVGNSPNPLSVCFAPCGVSVLPSPLIPNYVDNQFADWSNCTPSRE